MLGDERIFPVQTVTPRPDGSRVHEVQPGQSLWSIAVAYGVKIQDILRANNLADNQTTIYSGQKLALPLTAVQAPSPGAVFTPGQSPGARPNLDPTIIPTDTRRASSPTPALTEVIPAAPGEIQTDSMPILLSVIIILFALGVLLVGFGLIWRKRHRE